MKKRITLFLFAILLFASTTVYAASSIQLTYNGKTHTYSDKQLKAIVNGKSMDLSKTPGILEEGYALLPYVTVFRDSTLKVSTSYDKTKGTVTMKANGKTVKLTLGSRTAYVDGKKMTLGATPKTIKYKSSGISKIVVPSRFVAENLGFKYSYNSSNATVTISKGTDSSPAKPPSTTTKPPESSAGMKIKYGGKTYDYTKKPVNIFVEGDKIATTIPGLIINNISMLPANKTFSHPSLGVEYRYSSSKKTVELETEENIIQMTLGSKTAYVDGVKKTMPEAALLVTKVSTGKNYVMVPGQFIAQQLGFDYTWNNSTVTSSITLKMEDEDVDMGEDDGPIDDGDLGEDGTTQEPNPGDGTTEDGTTEDGSTEDGSTEDESTEDPNAPDVVNEYSVKIPLSKEVKKGTYSTNDDYMNKQFIVTIPGDWVSYYGTNKPEIKNKAASSVTATLNSNGDTNLSIKTTAVKGFLIEEYQGALYIGIKAPKEIYDKIVVLDAGHGGSDPGAMGNSLREKDVTLTINKYAKEYLDQRSDIKVYYTRLQDAQAGITAGSSGVANASASLAPRYNFANAVGADLFISVHINSATSTSARGTEVFYSSTVNQSNSGGLTSKKLAEINYPKLISAVGSLKRGVKSANFAVIKYTKMPAILIETAFISNAQDAAIMKSSTSMKKVGKSIFDTITEAFDSYPTGR